MAISGGNVYAGGMGGSANGLDPRVPEIWSGIIQEEMFAKAVATNWFQDLSREFDGGGDIAHVSDFYTNSFTAQTTAVGAQGTEVTLGNPALQDVTLTVDTDSYISFFLSRQQMLQLLNREDLQAKMTSKASKTLIDAVESAIFALWSGLTANTAIGDTGTVLTDLEIRQAIRTLVANNHDRSELAFFMHPQVIWDQVLGIQKFYDASQAGWDMNSVIRTGNFGPANTSRGLVGALYGIPVFESTNVVSGLQTYRNLLAHREAFGFAFQGGLDVRTTYENRNRGWLTVLQLLYGVTELRDEAAVLVNANTSATQS